MKNKSSNKIVIAIILSFSIIASSFTVDAGNENSEVRALFSWNYFRVLNEHTEFFEVMEKLNINTLYQEFSDNLKPQDIDAFLLEAEDRNINVSLLAGDSSWALDKNGENMVNVVDKVININQSLEKSNGIKSILFDVEPHCLEEWNKKSRKKIMNNFIKGIKIAHKKAKENNIEVIACIPFDYDDAGLTEQVKNLIKSGCDSIAIMNYSKGNEAGNIQKEVELAEKYGKRLINIYELQAPGQYGLKHENTYYKDGIEAIEESFVNIKEQLYGKDISIAFHEYNVLKEILERKS